MLKCNVINIMHIHICEILSTTLRPELLLSTISISPKGHLRLSDAFPKSKRQIHKQTRLCLTLSHVLNSNTYFCPHSGSVPATSHSGWINVSKHWCEISFGQRSIHQCGTRYNERSRGTRTLKLRRFSEFIWITLKRWGSKGKQDSKVSLFKGNTFYI